jgi:hypothetical protein
MTKNNVALVVHSCDRYQLLFAGFEYFFKENWDFEIPFSYYFATELLEADIPGFQNIKSGKGEWSDRLHRILDQIDEEYILYLQEDMWLNKPVDKEFFSTLVNLTMQQKWMQVKLNSSEVFKTEKTNFWIKGFNVARLNNSQSQYLMSHQITLWNKDFLKAQLKPGEHPWRNERRGTKRLRKLNPEIYHIDYFAENGHPAINENAPEIVRSEYQSISSNATLNQATPPYIEILKSSDQLASYALVLEDHYLRSITHDGKPKPLKKDIFKRMKEWAKSLLR